MIITWDLHSEIRLNKLGRPGLRDSARSKLMIIIMMIMMMTRVTTTTMMTMMVMISWASQGFVRLPVASLIIMIMLTMMITIMMMIMMIRMNMRTTTTMMLMMIVMMMLMISTWQRWAASAKHHCYLQGWEHVRSILRYLHFHMAEDILLRAC